MKLFKIGVPIFALTVALIAIAAPIGPLPGFFIGGTPSEAPNNWPDTSAEHEIRLKVVDVLPRVVIIWMVEYNQELYVVGAADSGWVRMIGESAPVKMRLNDSTYDLIAQRVTADIEAIATAYLDKYRADYPDIIANFPSVEEAEVSNSFRIFRLEKPAA